MKNTTLTTSARMETTPTIPPTRSPIPDTSLSRSREWHAIQLSLAHAQVRQPGGDPADQLPLGAP